MNREFLAENADKQKIRCVVVNGAAPQEPRGFVIISSQMTDSPQSEWKVLED